MTNLSLADLATVTGGADSSNVCLPGVKYDTSGRPEQSLTNISPGVRENQQMQQSINGYNKFYDNYTGLINAMNGIGGGAAVAGGASPSSVGF